MHVAPVASNPVPLAELAAVAARYCKLPTSSRRTEVLNARNAAIQRALGTGRSTAEVAIETGLTRKTILKLAKTAVRAEAASPSPRQQTGADRAPAPVAGRSIEAGLANAMVEAIRSARTGTCRMPIGEGDGFRFCGAPATVGHKADVRTYCAACGAVAFQGRPAGVRPASFFVARKV